MVLINSATKNCFSYANPTLLTAKLQRLEEAIGRAIGLQRTVGRILRV